MVLGRELWNRSLQWFLHIALMKFIYNPLPFFALLIEKSFKVNILSGQQTCYMSGYTCLEGRPLSFIWFAFGFHLSVGQGMSFLTAKPDTSSHVPISSAQNPLLNRLGLHVSFGEGI